MKGIVIYVAIQLLWIASYGQTNASPAFYVHFGYGRGTSAVQVLCTQAHLGEPIFVTTADLRYIRPWNNWTLTGDIEQQEEKLTANLIGASASESQFYKGPIILEDPRFAQGGAASGFVGEPMWFVVSTNFEAQPVLDRIKDLHEQTRKKSQ